MGPHPFRLAATAAFMAFAGAMPVHAENRIVLIEGMQFKPAAITVKSGDTVEWQNRDVVPHTVTASGSFDSGAIEPGKSWKHTVTQAARHEYVCKFHPGMKAVLVVQ
jgi:plastocyanin